APRDDPKGPWLEGEGVRPKRPAPTWPAGPPRCLAPGFAVSVNRCNGSAARNARATLAAMILAVDQGTSGTTCLVVGPALEIRGRGYREVTQHFPQPGWVEHDPEELVATVEAAAADALADARIGPHDLDAIAVANQRETTVLWERASGRPVGRAIVWQDRRTAERCRELPYELIRDRTGLTPDPYFSASKLEWLLAATERHEDL